MRVVGLGWHLHAVDVPRLELADPERHGPNGSRRLPRDRREQSRRRAKGDKESRESERRAAEVRRVNASHDSYTYDSSIYMGRGRGGEGGVQG